MESMLRSQKFGVVLHQCSFSVSSVRNCSFKDLPRPGAKVEKRLDAWSSSSEGKGGMKVKKVLLHPGEVSQTLQTDQLFEAMASK